MCVCVCVCVCVRERERERERADWKTRRYGDLVEEVGKQGYCCQTISLQVGSRGVIHEEGLNEFRCCLKPIPNKEWKKSLIPYMGTNFRGCLILAFFAVWFEIREILLAPHPYNNNYYYY